MKKVIDTEYLELVRHFPLRPLRSESDLKAAVQVIDDLIGRNTRSDAANDYLDVLSDLVERYEAAQHPIPDAAPIDVLKLLIDDRKTSQRAVAIGSGIQISTMSEILSGQRQINLEHIRKLAEFFKVDAAVFLPRTVTKPMPARTPVRKTASPLVAVRAGAPRRSAAKK